MMNPLKLLIALVVLGSMFQSCSDSESTANKSQKLHVVVTTAMIADLVQNVGGDSIEVTAIMGPGVDPHLYKATQGDLKKLRLADIVVYNGLHLEGKMGEVLEKMSATKSVIAVTEGLYKDFFISDTLFQGNYDPHIWFDVQLWKRCIPGVLQVLQNNDSANSEYFASQANRYSARLDSLHVWANSEIALIPRDKRVLVTAHDAFGYFGRAYGIQVRGLQGISTLSEFGLKDRIELIDFILEKQIPAVFVESSVPEKNIKSIVEGCQLKGHTISIGGNLFSDAMGASGTKEGTYIGMVTHNVSTIVKALSER